MAPRRRTIVIVASAVTATAAVIVAGVFFLGGRSRNGESGRVARRRRRRRPSRPKPLVSPFTGERVKALGPVLAVKIDNVVDARPPTGLTDADIVYLLPVEGGLSRIFAVFSSHFPPVIGPVRSAREDDIELLRQFGRPAFAYSGAQSQLLPVVQHARTVDLYAGTVSGPYFRDPNRIIPHNLYANTSQLLAAAHGASKAHDIGFRFGPPPPGGKPTSSVSVSYPAASFSFRWSARQGAVAGIDGRLPRTQHGGWAAERSHRGDPVHDRAHIPVPRGGRAAAIRREHGFGHGIGAARRQGL